MSENISEQLLGPIALVVQDLDRCKRYYELDIGLQVIRHSGSVVQMGVGKKPLLILEENPAAVRIHRSTGLYHMAFLLPTRRDLAAQIQHFVKNGIGISGMSDHGVSEALYLSDPEGNGIEIYSDRPRDKWVWIDGEVDMQTMPLDIDSLLAELPDNPPAWTGLPADTVLGHVHLRVSDLSSTTEFYTKILGLEVTTRSYPGAIFLSKNGYHHHLGLNVWGSAGAVSPPDGTAGLKHYTYRASSSSELERISQRAKDMGVALTEADGESIILNDPSGNHVRIKTGDSAD